MSFVRVVHNNYRIENKIRELNNTPARKHPCCNIFSVNVTAFLIHGPAKKSFSFAGRRKYEQTFLRNKDHGTLFR